MKRSTKIDKWFEDHHQKNDMFWDAIHEWQIYDEQQWGGDDKYDLFERGFYLGQTAADKEVYEYSSYEGEGLTLYFIGSEETILQKLNDFLEELNDTYPRQTEEEKQRSKLKKQKEKAERDLKLAQARVETLNNMLEEK